MSNRRSKRLKRPSSNKPRALFLFTGALLLLGTRICSSHGKWAVEYWVKKNEYTRKENNVVKIGQKGFQTLKFARLLGDILFPTLD